MQRSSSPVWVVSFRVGENGAYEDAEVREQDLGEFPPDAAGHLRSLMGRGVFSSEDEALRWAEAQTAGSAGCGCRGAAGGCGECKCPHKNEQPKE